MKKTISLFCAVSLLSAFALSSCVPILAVKVCRKVSEEVREDGQEDGTHEEHHLLERPHIIDRLQGDYEE